MDTRLEELERLTRLKEAGALTEDEFQTQKSRLLNNPPHGSASPAAEAEYSWNPFKPVRSREDAEALAKVGALAAAALIVTAFLGFAANVSAAVSGETLVEGLSNSDALKFSAIANGVFIVFPAIFGFSVCRRQRRWAAVALLLLSGLSMLGALGTRLDGDRSLLTTIDVFASGAALLFSIQAVRGAWAFERARTAAPSAGASASSMPASRIQQGWDDSRPVRHAFRWIGLLAALGVLGAAGIMWARTEGLSPKGEPAPQSTTGATPRKASQSASDGEAGPPQELLNAWDIAEGECRGGSGDDPATYAACDHRDAAVHQLNAQGWCYGRAGEISAEYQWHRCEPGSNGARVSDFR